MKASFEQVRVGHGRSYRVEEAVVERFTTPWHFHPEVELTWIVASRGRRIVGDSVESFVEGDLVLVGSELPHVWENQGRQVRGVRAQAVVVQFRKDFLGDEVWGRPEFAGVGRLLVRAERGLAFGPGVAARVGPMMRELARRRGMRGLVVLLEILDLLAGEREVRPLAAAGVAAGLDRTGQARVGRVVAYAASHVGGDLSLPRLAAEAGMTPAAFSRYFKRATGRNPSDFVNDLRVEEAGRMLREREWTVADVAGRAGFATLTSFHRRFKERMGMTPGQYRRVLAG